MRDFNVEFARLVLRLAEIQCSVPPMIKAWLYLDKLRLSETEELALLSSVNNDYDCRKLQHAALVQDRAIRRPNHWSPDEGRGGGKRWGRQSVHMTNNEEGALSSEDDGQGGNLSDDGEIVDEDTAMEHYSAYMTYQGAKAKYREVLKGRGVDKDAMDKRNQDRLRLAKQRSYCSACKRRGHWHKDPECPLRQKGATPPSTSSSGGGGGGQVQSVNFVHQCYMTENAQGASHNLQAGQLLSAGRSYETEYNLGASLGLQECGLLCSSLCFMTEECEAGGGLPIKTDGTILEPDNKTLLAIVDTACTKTVAGYDWFEQYVKVADDAGIPVSTVDEAEHFKFGASKVYKSLFAVKAWFAIHGKVFGARVSIVSCNVPLLFSRPVLGSLGMCYDVAKQQVGLAALGLSELPLLTSPTGHPALLVSDFLSDPKLAELPDFSPEKVHIPAEEVYMSASVGGFKPLFYPKKLSREIQIMLESNHTLSGASFMGWWKNANQSRDFWMETECEFIRVHVVPRKHLFNPSAWNTSLVTLKKQLLDSLDGHRITEHISCLSEGVLSSVLEDDTYQEIVAPQHVNSPWIGRSRFRKFKVATGDTHDLPGFSDGTNACVRNVAMVHEEGRADGRAGAPGSSSPCQLVGAGAAVHTDRTAGVGEACSPDQPLERADQDVLAGVGDRSRAATADDACQAHQGPFDADDSRLQERPRPDCREFWEVQGLDVPRDSSGVLAMEHTGGESQPEFTPRLSQTGNLGPRRDGSPAEGVQQRNPCGERPGDDGSGPSAKDEGAGSALGVVRRLLEQGRRLFPKGEHPQGPTGDQRQRPGGGGRRHQPHDQEVGGSHCCHQEAQQQLMLRHGELSHGGTSSEGRPLECAQGQPGSNYDIKYDAINLHAPDERMVTVNDATIGLSSNGSTAQHHDTKYNTITLDAPDEHKALVNEATIGLSVGGSEIKYDTLTLVRRQSGIAVIARRGMAYVAGRRRRGQELACVVERWPIGALRRSCGTRP